MASPPPLPSPVSSASANATAVCPSCGNGGSGRFCANCGLPLAGATCAACGAALTPGAKFCHRCGTPAGAAAADTHRSFSDALPWGVAGIALVALVALIAGQRVGRSPADVERIGDQATAPLGAASSGSPPDISNMTPTEAAVRLYNRVMGAHERGRADSVQIFAPMAITAYQMIGTLDLDQRYDLGRIAAVAGEESIARAQADTILAKNPSHLLGLILAGNAARLRKDTAAERAYHAKLVAAAPGERAKRVPEYITHENDIAIALDAKRP